MAQMYCIQHRTSKRYLTVSPITALAGLVLGESFDAAEAHVYEKMADAEIAHLALEEWAPAFWVVAVERHVPETVPDV